MGKLLSFQSFYGHIAELLPGMFNKYHFSEIDRVGIRLAVLALPNYDLFSLMRNSFFSKRFQIPNPKALKEGKDPEVIVVFGKKLYPEDDLDKERIAHAVADFFLIYMELLTNELDIYVVLADTLYNSKSFDNATADPVDHSQKFYQYSVGASIVQAASAVCPANRERFFKEMNYFFRDTDLLDKIFDELFILENGKLVLLNPMVLKTLDVNKLDELLLATDPNLNNTFIEGWDLHFKAESRNPFSHQQTFSTISKLLSSEIIQSEFWFSDFKIQVETAWMSDKTALLCIRHYLRCTTYQYEVQPSRLRNPFFKVIGKTLQILKITAPFAATLISKCLQEIKRLSKDGELQQFDEMNEEALGKKFDVNSNARQQELIRKKFEKVRDIQLKKIKRRLVAFMSQTQEQSTIVEGGDEGNKMLSSQVDKATQIDIRCAITREPLVDDKISYILCHIHITNILETARYSIVNRKANEATKDFDCLPEDMPQNVQDLLSIKSVAMGQCTNHISAIISKCGHKVSTLVGLKRSYSMVYTSNEKECPTCRAPLNLPLLVLPRSLIDKFNAPSGQLTISPLATLLNNQWKEQAASYAGLTYTVEELEILNKHSHEEDFLISCADAALKEHFNSYAFVIKGGTLTQPNCLQFMTSSLETLGQLVQILPLSELIGFYSEIYSNMLISLRLLGIVGAKTNSSINTFQEHQKIYQEGYLQRLKSILKDPEGPFPLSEEPLLKLYCGLISSFVGSVLTLDNF